MQNNKSIKRNLAAKIKKLAAKGYSFRKIEKKLGCSKGAISYHLSKGQIQKALDRQRVYKATFQLPRAVYFASVVKELDSMQTENTQRVFIKNGWRRTNDHNQRIN